MHCAQRREPKFLAVALSGNYAARAVQVEWVDAGDTALVEAMDVGKLFKVRAAVRWPC